MPRSFRALSFAITLLPAAQLVSSACAAEGQGGGATYATPEEAAQDADFALQGEYLRCGGGEGIQVIALGGGQFTVVKYAGGLPGARGATDARTILDGGPTDAAAPASAVRLPDPKGISADEARQHIAGCSRLQRQSPTLGAAPPDGAIILFDGSAESLAQHWKQGAQRTDDGLLMQGVTGTDEFKDVFLHLEFRLPYMPAARSQERGNSGLYLQGRYEVQMLDSFGLDGMDNECGGIYRVARPDVNMCLPPLSWQTYDVDFRAARFDAHGTKTHNAYARIWHNGVVIHDRELPVLTAGGITDKEADTPGPIYLQDHRNPVRYRNIWVVAR